MNKPRKPSLRDALAKRRVREDTFSIQIADDTEAQSKLKEMKQRLLLAGVGKDGEAKTAAQVDAREQVAAAQAEVDACWHPILLRALPRVDWEALRAAHPPKPGAPEDALWDQESLLPALVAACAVDADLSAEEWAEELKSWSHGDTHKLYMTAMRVNTVAVNEGLGKG